MKRKSGVLKLPIRTKLFSAPLSLEIRVVKLGKASFLVLLDTDQQRDTFDRWLRKDGRREEVYDHGRRVARYTVNLVIYSLFTRCLSAAVR